LNDFKTCTHGDRFTLNVVQIFGVIIYNLPVIAAH